MAHPPTDGPTEAEAWALLLTVEGVGPAGHAALLRVHGTALDVLDAARRRDAVARFARVPSEDGSQPALPPGAARGLVALPGRVEERLAVLRAAGVRIVTLDDPAYPERLRGIELSPPVLFVQGELDGLAAERVIAVVGTRRPSEHGRATATRIAALIANAGATVVSGLALGIDGAAHAAAVHARAPTIAVLGSGHDELVPRSHRRLANAILATGGAIVSEFWPDQPPATWTFPVRNRVISGLADVTVVVEAGETSGALITAKHALEQGRGLSIVPGRLGDPTSVGCLRWLRAYPGEARIVAGWPELAEDLGLAEAPAERPRHRKRGSRDVPAASLEAVLLELGETARQVGVALASGHGSLDDLVATTGFEPATVLGAITLLELRGLALSTLGRYRAAGSLAAAPEPARFARP